MVGSLLFYEVSLLVACGSSFFDAASLLPFVVMIDFDCSNPFCFVVVSL